MKDDYFLAEILQQVNARSLATSDFSEPAFASVVAEALVDSGAILGFEPAFFSHKGMRVDGYNYSEEEATLDLFVVDFHDDPQVQSLTQTQLETFLKRAETFFERAVDNDLAWEVDVGSSIWSLARQLAQMGESIVRIRLNVLSNAKLSNKVKTLPTKKKGDREWALKVWDLLAIGRMLSTGEPEPIIINFKEMFGKGLPCLPANSGGNELDSYLTVIPGDWLAEIYDLYGGRLLEQNVRTFLQATRGVNKGIRKTILEEPQMFFAYNNGISATAAKGEFDVQGEQILLNRLENLQIVNGGQTTASIFNVMKRDKAENLDRVRVQMKLSVVQPDLVDAIVPRISLFANSQNKVSDADFFSNHPFHRRVENFSRNVWAPAGEGTQQMTHWFYERARGQYSNASAYLTTSKKKEFEVQNPRKQLIHKTDIAKVLVTIMCMPHIVSQGAQKNFKFFAENVTGRWGDEGVAFGEDWFKGIIGATIVFRTLERLVGQADWYAQGYRANTVTYSISLLIHRLKSKQMDIDFMKIWNRQATSTSLNKALLRIAHQVQSRIIKAADTYKVVNVTEWCKREKCWEDILQSVEVLLDGDLARDLVNAHEKESAQRSARREQKVLNDIEAQTYVVGRGASYWSKIHRWASEGLSMTPSEIDFLSLAAAMSSRKIPSGPQSQKIILAEKKALSDGFKP
ncbi:AIPR family protein [Limnobacter alexandrii]|uniref:AIPR family protein n=1 Tax=Limnobacter alexandrii TaxID=2570352 RepID=UPI001109AC9D|nr:AIPR family protein [Limnobacter alexandrii]